MSGSANVVLRILAPSIEHLFWGAALGCIVEGIATLAVGADKRPEGSLLDNIKFFATCGSVMGAASGAVNVVMEDNTHRQAP